MRAARGAEKEFGFRDVDDSRDSLEEVKLRSQPRAPKEAAAVAAAASSNRLQQQRHPRAPASPWDHDEQGFDAPSSVSSSSSKACRFDAALAAAVEDLRERGRDANDALWEVPVDAEGRERQGSPRTASVQVVRDGLFSGATFDALGQVKEGEGRRGGAHPPKSSSSGQGGSQQQQQRSGAMPPWRYPSRDSEEQCEVRSVDSASLSMDSVFLDQLRSALVGLQRRRLRLPEAAPASPSCSPTPCVPAQSKRGGGRSHEKAISAPRADNATAAAQRPPSTSSASLSVPPSCSATFPRRAGGGGAEKKKPWDANVDNDLAERERCSSFTTFFERSTEHLERLLSDTHAVMEESFGVLRRVMLLQREMEAEVKGAPRHTLATDGSSSFDTTAMPAPSGDRAGVDLARFLATLDGLERSVAEHAKQFLQAANALALRCINEKRFSSALMTLLKAEAVTAPGAGRTFRFLPEPEELLAYQRWQQRKARGVGAGDGDPSFGEEAEDEQEEEEEDCFIDRSHPVWSRVKLAFDVLPPAGHMDGDGQTACRSAGPFEVPSVWELRVAYYAYPAHEEERLLAAASLANNYGLYHFSLKEYTAARARLQSAVDIELSLGPEVVETMGITFLNLAQANWELRRPRDALCCLEQCEEAVERQVHLAKDRLTALCRGRARRRLRGQRDACGVRDDGGHRSPRPCHGGAERSQRLSQRGGRVGVADRCRSSGDRWRSYRPRDLEAMDEDNEGKDGWPLGADSTDDAARGEERPRTGGSRGSDDEERFHRPLRPYAHRSCGCPDGPQRASSKAHGHVDTVYLGDEDEDEDEDDDLLADNAERRDGLPEEEKAMTVEWLAWREDVCLLSLAHEQHGRWLLDLGAYRKAAAELELAIRWRATIPHLNLPERKHLEELKIALKQCKERTRRRIAQEAVLRGRVPLNDEDDQHSDLSNGRPHSRLSSATATKTSVRAPRTATTPPVKSFVVTTVLPQHLDIVDETLARTWKAVPSCLPTPPTRPPSRFTIRHTSKEPTRPRSSTSSTPALSSCSPYICAPGRSAKTKSRSVSPTEGSSNTRPPRPLWNADPQVVYEDKGKPSRVRPRVPTPTAEHGHPKRPAFFYLGTGSQHLNSHVPPPAPSCVLRRPTPSSSSAGRTPALTPTPMLKARVTRRRRQAEGPKEQQQQQHKEEQEASPWTVASKRRDPMEEVAERRSRLVPWRPPSEEDTAADSGREAPGSAIHTLHVLVSTVQQFARARMSVNAVCQRQRTAEASVASTARVRSPFDAPPVPDCEGAGLAAAAPVEAAEDEPLSETMRGSACLGEGEDGGAAPPPAPPSAQLQDDTVAYESSTWLPNTRSDTAAAHSIGSQHEASSRSSDEPRAAECSSVGAVPGDAAEASSATLSEPREDPEAEEGAAAEERLSTGDGHQDDEEEHRPADAVVDSQLEAPQLSEDGDNAVTELETTEVRADTAEEKRDEEGEERKTNNARVSKKGSSSSSSSSSSPQPVHGDDTTSNDHGSDSSSEGSAVDVTRTSALLGMIEERLFSPATSRSRSSHVPSADLTDGTTSSAGGGGEGGVSLIRRDLMGYERFLEQEEDKEALALQRLPAFQPARAEGPSSATAPSLDTALEERPPPIVTITAAPAIVCGSSPSPLPTPLRGPEHDDDGGDPETACAERAGGSPLPLPEAAMAPAPEPLPPDHGQHHHHPTAAAYSTGAPSAHQPSHDTPLSDAFATPTSCPVSPIQQGGPTASVGGGPSPDRQQRGHQDAAIGTSPVSPDGGFDSISSGRRHRSRVFVYLLESRTATTVGPDGSEKEDSSHEEDVSGPGSVSTTLRDNNALATTAASFRGGGPGRCDAGAAAAKTLPQQATYLYNNSSISGGEETSVTEPRLQGHCPGSAPRRYELSMGVDRSRDVHSHPSDQQHQQHQRRRPPPVDGRCSPTFLLPTKPILSPARCSANNHTTTSSPSAVAGSTPSTAPTTSLSTVPTSVMPTPTATATATTATTTTTTATTTTTTTTGGTTYTTPKSSVVRLLQEVSSGSTRLRSSTGSSSIPGPPQLQPRNGLLPVPSPPGTRSLHAPTPSLLSSTVAPSLLTVGLSLPAAADDGRHGSTQGPVRGPGASGNTDGEDHAPPRQSRTAPTGEARQTSSPGNSVRDAPWRSSTADPQREGPISGKDRNQSGAQRLEGGREAQGNSGDAGTVTSSSEGFHRGGQSPAQSPLAAATSRWAPTPARSSGNAGFGALSREAFRHMRSTEEPLTGSGPCGVLAAASPTVVAVRSPSDDSHDTVVDMDTDVHSGSYQSVRIEELMADSVRRRILQEESAQLIQGSWRNWHIRETD